MREDIGLPDTRHFRFVARPFDDGEPRLVICNDAKVVGNVIWPARGSLDAWVAAMSALAETLRAFPTSAARRTFLPKIRTVPAVRTQST
jgi:hypothetical protein